jgi:hypothetical protein
LDLAKMQSLSQSIKIFVPTIMTSTNLLLSTASVYFVVNVLEFLQLTALYLFLGISLPSNFQTILDSLY